MISFYPLDHRLQFIYVAWNCVCNITEKHNPICNVIGEFLLLSTYLFNVEHKIFL